MGTPDLARASLDPGLFSDNSDLMTKFYLEEANLPFEERLAHSDTYAELFFSLPEGKLKIQSTTEPLEPAVTGLRRLYLARPGVAEPRHVLDPDGNQVSIVPPGWRQIVNVGIEMAVGDAALQRRFLVDGLGATELDDGLQVGTTVLFVSEDPSVGEVTPPWRRGLVYLTVIVHDAVATHQRLIDAGGQHSLRLLRLADRCLFSWVRDPHGNWIEIVQYAELSGPLPDVPRIADHWDEVTRWREHAEVF